MASPGFGLSLAQARRPGGLPATVSTVSPSGGLGLSIGQKPKLPEPPPATTVPPGPPARQRPPQQQSPAPNIRDDPLGAIGLLLQNVGAGIRGDELPSERLKRDAAAAEELELRRINTLFNAVGQATELALKTNDPEERQRIADAYQPVIDRLQPTIILSDLIPEVEKFDIGDAPAQIRNAPPGAKRLFALAVEAKGGDAAAMVEVATDKDFMALFQATAEGELRPSIEAKAAMFRETFESQGKSIEDMAGLTEAQFAQVNQMFQDTFDVSLTPQELRMVRDVPEFGALFGLEAPDVRKARQLEQVKADVRAGEKPSLQRLAGEAEAKARGKAAGEGRQLGTPRTVELTQDFVTSKGARIPKGTPISVRPIENRPFSLTAVGDEEVEIPDAIIPSIQRERESKIPTKAQQGKIALRIAFLDNAVATSRILKEMFETGTPTGFSQEAVAALQGTYDQVLTAAETIPGLDPLVRIVESALDILDRDVEGDVTERRTRLVDPNIPAIEVLEEGLAVALAASAFPSTQRIPVEAIKKARENVATGGFFGPGRDTALTRLDAVEQRLLSNRNALAPLAAGISEPLIEAEKKKPKESREKRIRRLKEKFGLE